MPATGSATSPLIPLTFPIDLIACSSSPLFPSLHAVFERLEVAGMMNNSTTHAGEEVDDVMKKKDMSGDVGGGEAVVVLSEDGAAKKRLDAGADEYDDRGPARAAEMLLRLAPMGLCLAALVIMLKNAQENDYGSVSYANITPFRYLVYANGLCAAYSLISAFYTAMPRPSTISRSWAVFFLDQVLTYVILAAGAVSAEVMYLAHKGDKEVTWSKECGVFDSFCHRATTSVGITFGSVLCYVGLSLISSYRLFSNFEAPIPALSNKGLEVAAFPR